MGIKTGVDRVVSPLEEFEDEDEEEEEEIDIEEIIKNEKEIEENNKELIETFQDSQDINVINDNNEIKELE